MIIRRAEGIRPSEITPFGVYLNRRQLIGAGTALSLGSLLARTVRADTLAAAKSPLSTDVADGAQICGELQQLLRIWHR